MMGIDVSYMLQIAWLSAPKCKVHTAHDCPDHNCAVLRRKQKDSMTCALGSICRPCSLREHPFRPPPPPPQQGSITVQQGLHAAHQLPALHPRRIGELAVC